MLRRQEDDIIRLCQGSEVIAIARLDGTVVECSKEGAEKYFGMTCDAVLKENILNLVDSSLDQIEFHKLIVQDVISGRSVDTSCLLRTKGKKTFIWADRRSPKRVKKEDTSDAVAFAWSHPKKTHSEKTYHALDSSDMSFNDLFEDNRASTSDVTLVSPVLSATSLTRSDSSSKLSPRTKDIDKVTSDDDSTWGWFEVISPSSSATFSNITSHIRVL